MSKTNTPPVVLIAGVREGSLLGVLDVHGYTVVQPPTGALSLDWAREVHPDIIILPAALPDMSGIAACRLLHGDPRIGYNVPILVFTPDKPTPEQRVTALGAGAWECLQHPTDAEELLLKLETYIQAKRSIDLALAEGLAAPAAGIHSRHTLMRRARELGALMARQRGALACIVFALDPDPADARAGQLVAQTTRVSDVVGMLTPSELAVLAPATEHAGAVQLAERVGGVLRKAIGRGVLPPGSTLQVGYDAVANLTYTPVDPAELLAHASAALRSGQPERGHAWVRRFEGTATSGPDAPASSRPSMPGSDKGTSAS